MLAAAPRSIPGPISAAHAEPDNLRTLMPAIDTSAQRAESAIRSLMTPRIVTLCHNRWLRPSREIRRYLRVDIFDVGPTDTHRTGRSAP
jgi:hypothetical protein